LTLDGFRMIGEKVREMSEVCHGKEIDMIGSGYNKKILPHAWLSLIAGLGGFKISLPEPTPVPEYIRKDPSYEKTKEMLRDLKVCLKGCWKCLEG